MLERWRIFSLAGDLLLVIARYLKQYQDTVWNLVLNLYKQNFQILHWMILSVADRENIDQELHKLHTTKTSLFLMCLWSLRKQVTFDLKLTNACLSIFKQKVVSLSDVAHVTGPLASTSINHLELLTAFTH